MVAAAPGQPAGFAGAAQFMVIPMLVADASLATIAVSTLVINVRHIFYGLSLMDRLPQSRLARGYLVWTLTDENYSVLTTLPRDTSSAKMLAVAGLNHFWWTFGAGMGAGLGTQAPEAINGLEFALAALFTVLAVEQLLVSKTRLAFPLALVAWMPMVVLPFSSGQSLLTAICIGVGGSALLCYPDSLREGEQGSPGWLRLSAGLRRFLSGPTRKREGEDQ